MTRARKAAFFIKVFPVDGAPVRLDVQDRLLSFEYEDHEDKVDMLKITLDNRDMSHFDNPLLQRGQVLQCTWGWDGILAIPRKTVITEIKGCETLEIVALGRAALMNHIAHSEIYRGVTSGQVAVIIAERNGFGPEHRFIEESGLVEDIVQHRLTDAQMMRRLANAEGFEFYIDWDGFHFHERVLAQRPIRKFTYYTADSDVDGILRIEIDNDVYAKPGRVRVSGIDPDTKEEVTATGDNQSTKRQGLAPKADIAFSRGSDELTLSETDLEKKQWATADDLQFQLDRLNREILRGSADEARPITISPGHGAKHAKRQADRRYRKASQTAVKMKITVIGDPRMVAKSVIRLEGVGKRLTGNYYVRSIRHIIGSDNIYLMEVTLRSDGTNGPTQDLTAIVADTPSKAKRNVQPVEEAPTYTRQNLPDVAFNQSQFNLLYPESDLEVDPFGVVSDE